MPNINELEAMPRRELTIFYVLDTSGSMEGAPVGTLNTAMRETVDILSEQAASNADALLKIAVLEFNSGADWLNKSGPEEATDFIWNDMSSGGLTDVGEALKELNDKLSKNKFLSSATGAYLPIIIFMSDGEATDNYTSALEEIRKNKWFARATKIGFALGENPDKKMIAEVVGSTEAVLATSDLDTFERLIKFVSTTSSMMCSSTETSQGDVTGADIVSKVIEQSGDDLDVEVGVGDGVDDINLPDAVNDTDDSWGDDDSWD